VQLPEGLVGAAFDASPTQTAIIDDDGEIVYTNRAWREFGAGNGLPCDVTGQNYLEVCDESDDERAHRIADGIRSLLAGERAMVSVEYPCHGPDEERWFTMRAEGFDHGKRRYALVVHLDITDRKQAERRVRDHNERLETMTGVLAHDLRNPLGVALGYATQLDSDDADTIVTSLQRMETIIEDVLALARSGDVNDTLTVELEERARAAWAQVETPNASLAVSDSASFEADPDLLDHVFENLFRNAVEHGSTGSHPRADNAVEHGSTGPRSQAHEDAVEHGSTSNRPTDDDAVEHGSTSDAVGSGDAATVTVRVGALVDDSTDGVAGFYVEDDGPGIPADQREAVLDRGYTTDPSSTGLGLAMVAHVVDAHDWTISIAEERTGGARFEVRF
jgi:PAS domain S-box-containing protein